MVFHYSALEQETMEFVGRLQSDYLERRDVQAVLDALEPGVTLIGTGDGEIFSDFEEAKKALAREFADYAGAFRIDRAFYEARELSERVCVVYGYFKASPDTPEIADLENRVSLVCVRTDKGMRLAHVHLSHADECQESGLPFVRKRTVLEQEGLRARVDESERIIKQRDMEMAALIENVPGGIHQCLFNKDFTLMSVTAGFLSAIGCTREELREMYHDRFMELIYPEDREFVWEETKRQLAAGDTLMMEYRVKRQNGDVIWVLDEGKLSELPDGTKTIYCMMLDVTGQHMAKEELRLSLERHEIIMDQATDIIFVWDIRKDTLEYSQNWRKKFGYPPIDREISRQIPLSGNIHPEDMDAFITIMNDAAAGEAYSETEFRIKDMMGNFIWCRIRATVQYNEEGRPVKAVGVILDIDEDKKQRQFLLDQLQRDCLTGILNKTAARKEVEDAIRRLRKGVLMMIDLDNFKGVNDRYGHLSGDAVLSDTAAVLKKLTRSTDVVARIGGDEFLVYLPAAPAGKAMEKAGAILKSIGEILIMGQKGLVSCSIGAAVFPMDGRSFPELYRCADLALYQVKNSGKGGFAFYQPQGEGGADGPNRSPEEPDGRLAHSALGAVIDSETGIINETLAQYCFRMLYRAIDPLQAIDQILEIVGRSYDVSRVYIFESSEDCLACSNTFEWCGEGVSPEIGHLQNLSYHEDLDDYMDNFDEDGVFYCNDIQVLKPRLYAVLAPQGIRSLLQCAIMDDGQFKGYVGFDECRENRSWTRAQIDTLTLVANVLSTFLMKRRLKEKIAKKLDCPGTGI